MADHRPDGVIIRISPRRSGRRSASLRPSVSVVRVDRKVTRALQARTRRPAALGLLTVRLVRSQDAEAFRRVAGEFFAEHDVLVAPVLPHGPLRVRSWSQRSWTANVVGALVNTAGLPDAWNFAGLPAMCLHATQHPMAGLPIGVQLVGAPGSERLLLGVGNRPASESAGVARGQDRPGCEPGAGEPPATSKDHTSLLTPTGACGAPPSAWSIER